MVELIKLMKVIFKTTSVHIIFKTSLSMSIQDFIYMLFLVLMYLTIWSDTDLLEIVIYAKGLNTLQRDKVNYIKIQKLMRTWNIEETIFLL